MELSSGTIKQENDISGHEQRKSSGVPTLMITVKNEMAHPIKEQTILTTGKNIYFIRLLMKSLGTTCSVKFSSRLAQCS
jgi:hypothetical protein